MDFTFLGLFGAGLLTFFSPCVLPMVPIIAANYMMAGSGNRFARFKATLLFSLGFLMTFTLMGLSLPFVSDFLGEAKGALLLISASVILIYGLKMSGIFFQNEKESRWTAWMTRSAFFPDFKKYVPQYLHGFLFGATFGLAWTPCVGPILGGVLTYVATKDRVLWESVVLMLSFALGIVLPFLAFALGGDVFKNKMSALKKHLPKIEQATGYALIFVAFMIFTQSNFGSLTNFNNPEEQTYFLTSEGKTTLNEVAPGASKLLFFYTSTCPICVEMEKYLPALEKECNSADFQVVRINVELRENQRIADQFKVRAVPTLSLISPEGREVAYTVGYQSEVSLRKAIALLPQGQCQKGEFKK